MSMSKRIGVAVISIIFLVALVSAVPVDANKGFSKYRWWSELWYTGYPEWTGHIWTGGLDDKYGGKHGMVYWDNDDDLYRFLGPEGQSPFWYDDYKVQQFSGKWWIIWDDGGYMEGTHKGSYSVATDTPIINGRITVVETPEGAYDWSFLLGLKIKTFSSINWATGTIDGYSQIN
ncbi:MAG: hypothetical protein ACFFCX_12245 [Candidatus Sifarchaeia archaeon]